MPYVYILSSKQIGTLYIGVTRDLLQRIYQHKSGETPCFTSKYNIKTLVYYEEFDDIYDAIQREKNLKHWPRKWKIALIEKMNPEWRDLYDELNC